MRDKLVEYLLGSLEIEETVRVDQALRIDFEMRSQLEVLSLALAPLEALRKDVDAPDGLASRTCQRLRAARQGQQPA
ncbi:MAG: hypothetical protein HY000_35910 [Planctomycetes bacterium]|nr:hypothetical protein [Planctomycetota bacterium]